MILVKEYTNNHLTHLSLIFVYCLFLISCKHIKPSKPQLIGDKQKYHTNGIMDLNQKIIFYDLIFYIFTYKINLIWGKCNEHNESIIQI